MVLFFKKEPLPSYLLLLATGAIAALGLPPFNLVPVLLCALAALLHLIGKAAGPWAAAARGLVFGIGFYGVGLYWITNAILVRAAEFWWAVPIAVPLLAAVLSIFIALACAIARLAAPGWSRVFMLAGGWTLADIARQFALSGFPWNPLGSAWEMPGTLGLIFMQPAAWVGVHGLTLATLLLAGCLTRGPRGGLAASLLLAVWAIAGWFQLRVPPTQVSPPGLMAVIAQGNISEADHLAHYNSPAWANQVFDKYLGLTRRGVQQVGHAPMLVIWPETASPYLLDQDVAARQAIADAAYPALATLAGTERYQETPGQPARGYNSLAAIGPNGTLLATYDKAHLVPFGEYFPSYAHFMLGEQGFTPGPGVRSFHLPGIPAFGPLICYEAIFPAQVVQPNDRPDLLVNITNDSWFGDSAGPRQHLAAARIRAVEEGLPMLRAANTGISAIIDSHGRLESQLGLDQAGILTGPVPGRLEPTLVSRLGLVIPAWLALIFVAFGLRPMRFRG